MSSPEIPDIPSVPAIEICDGCTEYDVLNFVNATNEERVDTARTACWLLSLHAAGSVPDVAAELTRTVENAREVLGNEKTTIDRLNGLALCKPGELCARLISYYADGNVYFGQETHRLPLRDLYPKEPPESS